MPRRRFASTHPADPVALRPARLTAGWAAAGVGTVVVAALLGIAIGPVGIGLGDICEELIDALPWIEVDSGLSTVRSAIIWDIRLPRVVLGLMVGAMLATSGAAYQGVFRNPLADPYLLGIAAGAGLGATIAIVLGFDQGWAASNAIPLAAFLGAAAAVLLTLMVAGSFSGNGSAATLLLAGVAVAALFTATQTYVQSREIEKLREVYAWILGRLSTGGWDEVVLLLPYAVVSLVLLLRSSAALDVLAVGEEEARSLGIDPVRLRWRVIGAASLAAAAAVSVSGLIGFVGIIVPHLVRLVVGPSHRVVLPLSCLFGGAFLVIADLLAKTVQSPAELPIGVVTAFFGAPFFLFVLRARQAETAI